MFSTVAGEGVWLTRAQAPSVTSLLVTLAQVTMMSRDHMLLLTREGQRLHPEDSLNISPGPPDQPDFYLYSITPCSYNKVINIPDLVKLALTDTKRSLQDYHLKKMFAQGYHFINEHWQNIRHMVTSLKLLETLLRTKLESLADLTQGLGPDKLSLEVKWEMFKESFQVEYFYPNNTVYCIQCNIIADRSESISPAG